MLHDYGVGPHATPLIAVDRLFTIGAMTHFNCFDKKTGKVLWSRNLHDELGVSHMLRGYGSSPIAYEDLVIVSVGPDRGAEEPTGLAAFKQKTGEVVWKSEPLSPGYPTPVLVELEGRKMLVGCLGITRFALDPATGETLWKTRFGESSDIVGSSVVLNGARHAIVGIMPEAFDFLLGNETYKYRMGGQDVIVYMLMARPSAN